MPTPGTKPVMDRSQVRRTNADVIDWTEVDDVPFLDAPPLPPRSLGIAEDAPMGALDRWPDATMRWYRAISRMPHAKLWDAAMWQYVFDVAECHARFVDGWKGHGGAELRMREKLLGNTPDARRDLRIRYVEPGATKKRAKAAGQQVAGTNVIRGGFGDL